MDENVFDLEKMLMTCIDYGMIVFYDFKQAINKLIKFLKDFSNYEQQDSIFLECKTTEIEIEHTNLNYIHLLLNELNSFNPFFFKLI